MDNSVLDRVFMALADKTRRALVHKLANSSAPLTMNELAQGFDMSLPAVSKHVKVLESAKIVRRTVAGREHRITLQPEQLAPALDWISVYRSFWQQRLDMLANVIEQDED